MKNETGILTIFPKRCIFVLYDAAEGMRSMTISFQADTRILADYLGYLFPPDKDGVLQVSVTSSTGKLLLAFAKCSQGPVPCTGPDVVRLALPAHHLSSLNNRFLYYTKEDMIRLNLALRAEFDLDFEAYFRRGEALGIQKKDIIDAFIFSRKLTTEADPDTLQKTHATLHKRIYRKQLNDLEDTRRKLLRKAYYINESINTTGLEK